MFSLLHETKKQKGISFFLSISIGLTIIALVTDCFLNTSSFEDKNIALVSNEKESSKTNNGAFFVPAIAIIKTGDPAPPAAGPCVVVDYTYTVTNESTNGEILENVEVTDPQLGRLVPMECFHQWLGRIPNFKILLCRSSLRLPIHRN